MTIFWLNFAQMAESASIQYLKNHLSYVFGFGLKRCRICLLLVLDILYGLKLTDLAEF